VGRWSEVLAVAAADIFGRGDEGGPDRGRGSLVDGLELEGRPALGRQLGVDPLHGRLELAGLQMPAELIWPLHSVSVNCAATVVLLWLWFVALLVCPGCLTHLIVLRFSDAFLEHLRTLASSLGIFIFSEGVCCLPSR